MFQFVLIATAVLVEASPRLMVGLKHPTGAIDRLQQEFFEVADPANPKYQKYLSNEELAKLTTADENAHKLASEWLTSIDANMATLTTSSFGDVLTVEWEQGHSQAVAPPVLSAEARAVIEYVMLVKPGVVNTTSKVNVSRVHGLHASDSNLGPAKQRAAYDVPSGTSASNAANIQMVYGPASFGYRPDDIDMFFSQYASWSSSKDVSFDKDNVWDGHTGKNFPEGTLDVSYIAAMAGKAHTLVYNNNNSVATEGGEAFGGALLQALVNLNERSIGGSPPLPLVLSMSLGSLSFGSCDKLCKRMESKGKSSYSKCWAYLQSQFQVCMFESQDQVDRIEVEFMKLGLKGVTITAAAGDGGSHFAFGPFSDGGLASDLNEIICGEMNMPVYPTSSPYVLSVGGTQWAADSMYGPDCSSSEPCGWSSGGGGFSWNLPYPPYQQDLAMAYVTTATGVSSKIMSAPTTYNATGRAYPDISALAEFGIPLCTYGGCSGSGGTSASAPTVAGLLSLINDVRLSKGLKSLGFINTKLYKAMQNPLTYAQCFNDIGVEKVEALWDCDTFSSCTGCNNGFIATTGWDAQTGFGQPKFPGLLQLFSAN